MNPATLLLALLAACSASSSIQEIECTDLDGLNRGGSVHVIASADPGGVIDVVWCNGVECDEVPWWSDDGDIVTSCPTVDDDEDRGVLWVRVER